MSKTNQNHVFFFFPRNWEDSYGIIITKPKTQNVQKKKKHNQDQVFLTPFFQEINKLRGGCSCFMSFSKSKMKH